jgi:twinkle protein
MPKPESPPIESYGEGIGRMLVTRADEQFDSEPEREVVDVAEFTGEELLAAHRKRHAVFGTTPFDPNGELLRLYPGGVTIWSGYPGAGKTTLLRQLVCHCLHRRSSVFLASLEEDPMDVLVGLASVAAGTRDPSAGQVQSFIDNYAERFRLWGVIGIARHKRLLAVIRQLAEQGIKHAIIDSLMCLDVPNDDYEGQRQFANLLATTARASKIHVHLVAHPRKAVSADQEPDLNDVAGAREIGGIADNVIFVRRAGRADGSKPVDQTPMQISLRKQRHGSGWLGDINGWFHRRLRQYNAEQFAAPTRYLPDDQYENEQVIQWAPR